MKINIKIKKIVLIIFLLLGIYIISIGIKYTNWNVSFYGKYEISSIVEISGRPLDLFKTEEEAREYENYLDFNLNYDKDNLINKTIELNEKFVKLDNKIILENPKYEIDIIPSSKIDDFYYKKIPNNLNDIINENEPYFIYVDIINLDIRNFKQSYYLSSFYLKDNDIILDSDGEFFTRYKAEKLQNNKNYFMKGNNIKLNKYTNHLFYGLWSLSYDNNFYKIDINEEILDVPYKIKLLKQFDLNSKEKEIFKYSNISNVICIEFESNNLYKSKIEKIYILDENKLVIYIENNYYELNRIGDITEYNYSKGI